ncbi:MAG: formyltransferase family protein [Pigmentiphaga sp.]
MNRPKVVFLGSRPLGFYALKFLIGLKGVDIVGKVTRSPAEGCWWKEDPYYIQGVPSINIDSLKSTDFDLGLSVNFWEVIPREILKASRLGFVNVHHSYMMQLKGRDMATRAIIQARPRNTWFHGSSIHYIDEGLDTGPVICTESCPITEYDTAWTLFQKSECVAKKLLRTWLPRVLVTTIPTAVTTTTELSYRRDLSRYIACDAHPFEIYDHVRALEFPGNFERPYTIISGEKRYLTVLQQANEQIFIDLGKNRRVYISASCCEQSIN